MTDLLTDDGATRPDPEGDGRIGSQVDRYRLRRLIGAGGGGEVWLAWDLVLHCDVALKLLRRGAPGEAAAAAEQRFRREARLAARLTHPNVVATHNYGRDETSGRAFIVMAHIDGPSLAELLERHGALPPQRVAAVVSAVAAALDHAHALSEETAGKEPIVHRDVKPSNILLAGPRGTGHVYLADFGVARLVAPPTVLTQAGAIVGTAGYIAPEAWLGEPTRPVHDLYGLAVTTFEALTGERPFWAEGVYELRRLTLDEDPPLVSSCRPGLSTDLDEVLARALSRDPRARYGSAGQFAAAFTAAVAAPPARRSRPPAGTSAPGGAGEPAGDQVVSGRATVGPPGPPGPPFVSNSGPIPLPPPIADPPDDRPVEPVDPAVSVGRSWPDLPLLGSAPHFVGLTLAGIVLVLTLLDVVPGGAVSVAVTVAAYLAGVLFTAAARSRREGSR